MGFAWRQGPGSSAGAIFYHIVHFTRNFAWTISLRIFSNPR